MDHLPIKLFRDHLHSKFPEYSALPSAPLRTEFGLSFDFSVPFVFSFVCQREKVQFFFLYSLVLVCGCTGGSPSHA